MSWFLTLIYLQVEDKVFSEELQPWFGDLGFHGEYHERKVVCLLIKISFTNHDHDFITSCIWLRPHVLQSHSLGLPSDGTAFFYRRSVPYLRILYIQALNPLFTFTLLLIHFLVNKPDLLCHIVHRQLFKPLRLEKIVFSKCLGGEEG